MFVDRPFIERDGEPVFRLCFCSGHVETSDIEFEIWIFKMGSNPKSLIARSSFPLWRMRWFQH